MAWLNIFAATAWLIMAVIWTFNGPAPVPRWLFVVACLLVVLHQAGLAIEGWGP